MVSSRAHFLYVTLVGACVSVVLLVGARFTDAQNGSMPNCQTTIFFMQPDPGTSTNALDGVVPIQLQSEPNTVKTTFYLDDTPIGRGQSDAGGSAWFMPWDTRYAESSEDYELTAVVTFDNGNRCRTFPQQVFIDNQPEFELDAELIPDYWVGPTNSIGNFFIDFFTDGSATGGSLNIEEFAHVQWSVEDRGTITPKPNSEGRFYSGPDEGFGEVRAVVSYGGSEIELDATVEVFEQYDPVTSDDDGLPGDETEEDGDAVETDDPSVDSEEQPQRADSPLSRPVTVERYIEGLQRTDREVTDCFELGFGDDYDEFLSANRRPTHTEFRDIVDCFEPKDYVVPSTFAPVAPDDVTTQTVDEGLVVNEARNQTVTNELGDTQQVIMLSGMAEPNTTVIIYVYSEPLVLVAQADDQGLWEYTLEDPLPSGKHEVYALVDRGDGEYQRSDVASFFIGTAEATEENPNGYSLALIQEPTVEVNNRSANVFIATAIGITTFALTSFTGFLIYRYRSNKILYPTLNTPKGQDKYNHPERDDTTHHE